MIKTQQANKAYLLIAMSLNFAPVSKLLEGTQLTPNLLVDKETIDMPDAIQMVHNLNKYSETKIWPALLGKQLGVSSHGPVGYASVSAPTLGKALSTFVEWYKIRSDCYQSQISETEETFEIIINDTSGNKEYQEFFFEALMRAFELFIGLLIGQPLVSELIIHFKSEVDNRKNLMLQEYDSQLFFSSSDNKMIIPKPYWFMPSPLYDLDSYEFNLAKCKRLLEQMEEKGRLDLMVVNIIKNHFEKAITLNDTEITPPSLKEVAKVLHTTNRTLIRKLKQYDSSYKTILEQQRQCFAVQLLADARYQIYQIAEILGYKEPANFTRAFKKWLGVSPSNYRRGPINR